MSASLINHKPWEGMLKTRYQGSKRKVLHELYAVFREQSFRTCLDAFGGTGSVTHCLARMGKHVTFNDVLPFNVVIAKALFSNKPIVLTRGELENLFTKRESVQYHDYIATTYRDIYYLDHENVELDIVCQNIPLLKDEVARCEAYYAFFQALLRKRPYNLFHRANLHMRTNNVERSFGNKATWDRPFLSHMLTFYEELRKYRETPTKHPVQFLCESAFSISNKYDLVYIDTPYAKGKGIQESNYFNFYHFLDAVLDYDNIPRRALCVLKHRPIYEYNRPWYPHNSVLEAFNSLFNHFRESILVISYRSDGHPMPDELMRLLHGLYREVQMRYLADYKYVLSSRKANTKEMVIVASVPIKQ